MGEDSGKPDHAEALAMLDICASVGATAVDLTLTNIAGEKEWFRRNLPLAELSHILPAMLNDAAVRKRNVIIRPHGPRVMLLQLDDLKAHQLPAVAFVALETSPGNYQAWLAIPGPEDKEFVRRVKLRTDADMGASGATRIPGSLNFKPDHAPEKTGRLHYPRVSITETRRGQITSTTELEQLGLVAPKEHFAPIAPARFESANLRQWPSYQITADGAPLNKAGTGPDLSRADFVWCMTCSTWGFDEQDIIERLLEVSAHARAPSNGQAYAERTAKRAAAYVEQRRRQKQMRHWG